MHSDNTIGALPGRDLFDGLVVFLRVAECRSFRAAADSLGMSPSAVGQTVRALEQRLGAPLLARTTRQVGLTEAGRQLLPAAQESVRLMQQAAQGLHRLTGAVGGTLRLTMPRAVMHVLAPLLLERFAMQHPALELEIHADDRLVDLVQEGFDAGLRVGEVIARDMVAVRVSPPFPFVVVGSPAYLAQHGVPARPEELHAHRCIRYRQAGQLGVARWDFLLPDGRALSLLPGGGPIVNDPQPYLHAALAGAGLAHTARPLVQRWLDSGELVPVLQGYMPQSSGLFVCYPSRQQALPRLRAFVEFAHEHFGRYFHAPAAG